MKTPKEIGEILKATRKKNNIKIENILKETRMQSSVVRALEEGNAYELLNKIYTVLSLKKYATFLGLDAEELAREYKKFYGEKEKQVFEIPSDVKKVNGDVKEKIRIIVSIVLVLLAIFVFFTIVSKIKNFVKSRPRSVQKKALIAPQKAQDASAKVFPIPAESSIKIDLSSTDDVWLNVKEGGKTVFTGTLKRGDKKEIKSQKELELWIGRAEVLNLSINGKPIGPIGRGNIKKVIIDRQGVRIGQKWLFKADR